MLLARGQFRIVKSLSKYFFIEWTLSRLSYDRTAKDNVPMGAKVWLQEWNKHLAIILARIE